MNTSRMPRQIVFVLVVMSIVFLVSATVAVWSVYRAIYQPIEYQAELLGPLREFRVCPDDTISFGIRIQFNHSPALVQSLSTWWSVDKNMTIVRDAAPEWSIITENTTITRTLEVQVPRLEPGRYEYRRSAQDDGSPPSVITVPVIIKDCP